MNQRLTCIVCSTPLTGKQRFYCSGRCRKRGQRHPDRYPKPQSRNPAPEPQAGNAAPLPPLPRAGRITAAVHRHSKKEILDELLLRLAMEVDQATDPKAVASLSARLVDVIDRVETSDNDSHKEGSVLDDLAARRTQRTTAG